MCQVLCILLCLAATSYSPHEWLTLFSLKAKFSIVVFANSLALFPSDVAFPLNKKKVLLKIKATFCFKCNLHFYRSRDSYHVCVTLCFPTDTDGRCRGRFPTVREWTDQVWHEHYPLFAFGLCLWLKLSLVVEVRWDADTALVWKISAISVSAAGLMRTRGAEPGKGCAFVWVPISIKQQ